MNALKSPILAIAARRRVAVNDGTRLGEPAARQPVPAREMWLKRRGARVDMAKPWMPDTRVLDAHEDHDKQDTARMNAPQQARDRPALRLAERVCAAMVLADCYFSGASTCDR